MLIIIAPHADDEVLGCGGLILKRISEGHEVGELLMTDVTKSKDYDEKYKSKRSNNIKLVCEKLGIRQKLFQLNFYLVDLMHIQCKI